MNNIIDKIGQLKKEKNAVIIAHNYQIPEVQDIADFVGDSLGLSIEASRTGADIIVFCGVHFMAETAKILSPQKTVLLPDKNAGCPMADMIDAAGMKKLKKEHPQAVAMCYVNTSAAVKAECDYCCTSSNGLKMARHILKTNQEIIFVPDKYLAQYVSEQLNHKFITWEGYCPTHARILPEHVIEARKLHPGAKLFVHPECRPEVTRLADAVLSTEKMCTYARENEADEFIVGTEIGIIHRLQKENPSKHFYRVSDKATCPNMKRINLEKVLWSLEDLSHQIEVRPDIMDKARLSIERMLQII